MKKLSTIIADIKATRNCEVLREDEYQFEAEDNVFKYKLESNGTLYLSIRSLWTGRWFSDTDMIVFDITKKKVPHVFTWANRVLATSSFDPAWGLNLEYPRLIANRRVPNRYHNKSTKVKL